MHVRFAREDPRDVENEAMDKDARDTKDVQETMSVNDVKEQCKR